MTLWKRKRVSVSKTEYKMTIWKRKRVSVSTTAIHFWKRKRVSRKRVSVSTAIHFRWPVFLVNSAKNDPAKKRRVNIPAQVNLPAGIKKRLPY